MKKDFVYFRGVTEGVYLEVKGKDFEAIKKELDEKMKNSYKFFEGAKFLGIRCDELTKKQVLEITLILKYKYDFDISKDEILDSLLNVEDNFEVEADSYSEDIIDEGKTKFIYGTVRSGQTVEYDGNIVIIGDVNPGAFLKAKGNIIVLGTLRGVAQAGDGGNKKAVVAAYCLLPTQLRIGDLIERSPDGDMQYKLPEIARIINGKVLIEPYLPNK